MYCHVGKQFNLASQEVRRERVGVDDVLGKEDHKDTETNIILSVIKGVRLSSLIKAKVLKET